MRFLAKNYRQKLLGRIGHRYSPAGSPVDPASLPSQLRHSLLLLFHIKKGEYFG